MLSSNITNIDKETLILCTGLNDCKKSDTNGEQYCVLGIIHLENIETWNSCPVFQVLSLVNIDLTDYLHVQGVLNTSFNFITESIHDLAKFDVELRNGDRELLQFGSKEKKAPQINFSIYVKDG